MIRVRAGERRITVSGHAGHAPVGQDIVCAAVSALMYALAGYLEETGQAARSDILPLLKDVAKRTGIPVVATNDCHY